jgi:hypothetical protein
MNTVVSKAVRQREYAQAQRLFVREIYDALAALRGKRVLPKGREPKSQFVPVRVAPPGTNMMIPMAHSMA